MILRLFKGTGPGVIFLIVVTLISLWASAFIKPQIQAAFNYETIPMPLYGLLKQIIGSSSILGVIFSISLVCVMAFLLVNLNTSVFFINERTFLPAFFYILFGGFFPQYQVLNPVLPASVFLMLAIRRIMDGYREPGISYNFFDAGILVSAGSLFYANLIWFGLLVIIGIALLRTGNLMEIALSILGLLTPYFLVFGIYYVIGKDLSSLLSLIEQNLSGRSEGYIFQGLTIVALMFAGIVTLICIAYLFMHMNTKKIKSRKTFFLLVWVFLISIGVYFIMPSVSVEIVWLVSIPISYFLTHYFVLYRKKLIPEILFAVLFVLVLLVQVLYLK